MNTVFRSLAALLALLLATHAMATAPGEALANAFHQYDEGYLELHPSTATQRGDRRYDDRLDDEISDAFLAREAALANDGLRRIAQIERAALTPRQQVSYDTFRFNLELVRDTYASGVAAKQAMMPLGQTRGEHLDFARLGSGKGIQPFTNLEDHELWLRRASQWPAWVDLAIANMRRGIRTGVVQPRVVAERVLPQLAAHLVDDPTKSVFYGPVVRIPAGPGHDALVARYRALITDSLVPAYRKLHDFMVAEYLPAARTTVARSALPGGKAWYALDIRKNTTLDRSAQQIHQLGLEQMVLLHAEMDQVRRQLKFDGDLHAFFDDLRSNAHWRYPSGEAALAHYASLKNTVREQLPQMFGRLPRADYEVRPVEAFRAAGAAGGSYQRPDVKGTRPGVFYLNTHDLSRIPTYKTTSMLLHETEPGHHLQIALAGENSDIPEFQRFGSISAFTEGWALYAETLGRNMHLYDDPVQYLGFLHNRLYRANRLVIDTGLHAFGWSRERAIQHFLDNSPMSRADASAEVERYIAWPGQALAYMTGALEIQRLRDEAQTTLGVRFDLRDFHDEVLADGIVPLPVLQAKIARWVEKRALVSSPAKQTCRARKDQITATADTSNRISGALNGVPINVIACSGMGLPSKA